MHLHAQQAKAILFDHDDTLVGTLGPKSKHHKHVAKTFYGKDLTDEEIREHWGKPLQELVCLLYGTDDAGQAMANNQSCHEKFPKELFAGTVPTLQHLKKVGKTIGIVTATSRFSLESDLDVHGFPRKAIHYLQTADDTPHHKPDARVFEPALKWLGAKGINAEEILYVGDSLRDMEAALGAGIKFLGVETGSVTADQFKTAGVYSVPDISRLVKADYKSLH